MLAYDSLATLALLELSAPDEILPDLPDPEDPSAIFSSKLEYAHYLTLLREWDNNFDLRELLILLDAIYLDVVNIRLFLTTLLSKLDNDAGVSDSDYTSVIPVRNQTFLR